MKKIEFCKPFASLLTTGLDTGAAFTGGSGADTFNSIDNVGSTIGTFTSGDSLTGGLGTDTLLVAVSGATSTVPSVSTNGIDVLSIVNNSTSGTYTLAADLMSGLQTVKVSDEAKKQLQMLQYVDSELTRLQAQGAVLQTASAAYANALKAALPSPLDGDTMKFPT